MECHYASDQTLLVSFGTEIKLEIHEQVRKLIAVLEQNPIPEIIDLHPAYCSVLVRFNALSTTHRALETWIRRRLADVLPVPPAALRTVEIPVCYGGEFGPDLESVAELCNISVESVIRIHSSASFRVYFLGFVPGFAYLGGLPDAIAVSRLNSPRKAVTPGSVGIAGSQSGVYPFPTPGGWRLIGRTPLRMFDAIRDPMSLLSLGDEVRFRPISEAEFRA